MFLTVAYKGSNSITELHFLNLPGNNPMSFRCHY